MFLWNFYSRWNIDKLPWVVKAVGGRSNKVTNTAESGESMGRGVTPF